MAVMQTPHGRVIGLIFPVEDQPKAEAVEKEPEAEAKVEAAEKAPEAEAKVEAAEKAPEAEAKAEAKPATAKKAGLTAKK